MAQLPKIKTSLYWKDCQSYFFECKSSNLRFSVPIAIIHKMVEFPAAMIDAVKGELVLGSEIDMVVKTAENGTVMYFPDMSIYRKKNAPQVNDMSHILASNVLNLMDHINEISQGDVREIVKALSQHKDEEACYLIRKALNLL